MKKGTIIKIVEEVILYVLAITIVEIIAHRFGLVKSSIVDNIIGLTIGFILWEIIMLFINKKKQK